MLIQGRTTPHNISGQRMRRMRANTRGSILFLDAAALILPLLRFVEIDVIGRLYLTEALLAALLLLLSVKSGYRLFKQVPLSIICLLLTWLFSQILTDLIVAPPFQDYARGWSKIGFTLINFCAIYLLVYGSNKRTVLFVTGAAVGDILSYLISPDIYSETYPWKFGYGLGITWLTVLLCSWWHTSRNHAELFLPLFVLLTIGFINIYMGFRSLGGILLLTGFYFFLQKKQQRRGRQPKLRLPQLFIIGTILIITGLGIIRAYEYSSSRGWLGEKQLEKHQMQAVGDYGLLIGGRTEILVSSRAIADSPLIGHGSWAKDCNYASLYIELKSQAGYAAGGVKDDCQIPAHSYLMGSWVEGGIIGGLVWLLLLCIPIRRLFNPSVEINILMIPSAFVAFLLIWDILFSPYAAFARFMVPFYIVLLLSTTAQTRNPAISRLRV